MKDLENIVEEFSPYHNDYSMTEGRGSLKTLQEKEKMKGTSIFPISILFPTLY